MIFMPLKTFFTWTMAKSALNNFIYTLMRVFRWKLFRALFQPELRHFRSFLDMHDLALWMIFNLSHLPAVLVLTLIRVPKDFLTLFKNPHATSLLGQPSYAWNLTPRMLLFFCKDVWKNLKKIHWCSYFRTMTPQVNNFWKKPFGRHNVSGAQFTIGAKFREGPHRSYKASSWLRRTMQKLR